MEDVPKECDLDAQRSKRSLRSVRHRDSPHISGTFDPGESFCNKGTSGCWRIRKVFGVSPLMNGIGKTRVETYIPVNIAPTYNAPMVGATLSARFTNRESTTAAMSSKHVATRWKRVWGGGG
jgi:hypothetical protein